MKRVLILTSDLYRGGVAESARKICKMLAEDSNLAVTVCVYESLEIKKELPSSVNVVVLGFPLVKEYHQGRRFFEMRRLIGLIPATVKLAKLKHSLKPDTTYSMMYIPNIINVLSNLLSPSLIVLSERQNPSFDLGPKRLQRIIFGWFYRAADRVHANSMGLVDEVEQFYELSRKKICYFPNFFDLPAGRTPRKRSGEEKELRVLIVGRNSRQKGFRYLPPLVELLPKNIRINIVCSESEHSQVLSLFTHKAIQSGAVNVVRETGKMEPVYKSHDVLLVVSLWESFGNVIVEAMSHGLPVVSSRCPTGPIEIIGSRWGMMTTSSLANNKGKALSELSFFLKKLYEDKSYYNDYSSRSIERSKSYSFEKVRTLIYKCLYLESKHL